MQAPVHDRKPGREEQPGSHGYTHTLFTISALYVKHTQQRYLWAGPERRQQLLCFCLFTDNQKVWANEERSHVRELGVFQEGQHHLQRRRSKFPPKPTAQRPNFWLYLVGK